MFETIFKLSISTEQLIFGYFNFNMLSRTLPVHIVIKITCTIKFNLNLQRIEIRKIAEIDYQKFDRSGTRLPESGIPMVIWSEFRKEKYRDDDPR